MPPLRRILIGGVTLLLLSIAVTYYLFEVERIVQIEAAITEREALLQEKRDNVRDYREKVEFYKTSEGIEHLAREQYNLVGNGERVFLLRDPDAGNGSDSDAKRK